ncbi:hypothetical protein BCT47_15380 [Vibrio splendidus]|uniref:Resolvase/invertase-type recombinase catalytic domain-containing protein n=4 Tax=Vibrio TaxID=662 RepID=A0A2N7NGI9_9VIBR|nr:hypothetical protein A163_05190 [Vibrio tasmaniensis 1F-267]OEF71329.1 hypothetical protein A162_03685 [Vibrio tasmaniensis 1F-155]PMG60351.1 hypothetical protein BCU89_06240 [Vibrio splendidus]PMK11819.1 hypothetical protein BCU07_01990 [Vibrio sp. 10N.261.54.E10]PMO80457.1 hypothetical protein BCT01_01535 [Vibrio tasmaniensis]CAK2065267.1 Resolvase/invertase-type recombinase catalytic domain-containing protein [Vibrio crassostreae]
MAAHFGLIGKIKWRPLKLGVLVEGMTSGDCIVFAEVSRIARSTLQVLEVLEVCMKKKINVYIAKENLQLYGSRQSHITAKVLGIAAEIERELISLRTKEALAARKKNGMILGRLKGQAERVKRRVRCVTI